MDSDQIYSLYHFPHINRDKESIKLGKLDKGLVEKKNLVRWSRLCIACANNSLFSMTTDEACLILDLGINSKDCCVTAFSEKVRKESARILHG